MAKIISGIVRIILYILNLALFILGLILLIFGIIGVASPTALTNMIKMIPGVANMAVVVNIPAVVDSGSIYMIIIGGILFVFGFFGCCGLWKQVSWMLLVYWIVIGVLILAEIGLIIFAAVAPATMQEDVQTLMMDSLKTNFIPVSIGQSGLITLPPTVNSVAWVSMQFEVPCCGSVGPSDFTKFKWNNTFLIPMGTLMVQIKNAKVPPSCCEQIKKPYSVPTNIDTFQNLPVCLENGQEYVNRNGCYLGLVQLIKEYGFIAIGIAAGLIAVEAIIMVLMIHQWRKAKTDEEDKS